jgi:hypothetical protein
MKYIVALVLLSITACKETYDVGTIECANGFKAQDVIVSPSKGTFYVYEPGSNTVKFALQPGLQCMYTATGTVTK